MSKHEIGCGIIRDLLPPYADGLAGPESRALVDEHLESCEACGDALEQLRGEAAQPPLPPDKALGRVKKQINKRRLRTGIIAGAAGLAAATALGFFLFAFPLNVRVTKENITNVEQRTYYDPADGKPDRELRMEFSINPGPWRAWDEHRFHDDGSTTIIRLISWYRTPWESIGRFLDIGTQHDGFMILGAHFDDPSDPGRLISPTGPIHWQVYTVRCYDWYKIDPVKMPALTDDVTISLLDKDGELKPEVAKYCTLLWSETTE
jgi:hypothetical protein